eukprot:gene10231-11922_t
MSTSLMMVPDVVQQHQQPQQYASSLSSSSSSVGAQSSSMGGMVSAASTHSPQIGSFTQNYELYSMRKLFCINTTTSGGSTSSSSPSSSTNYSHRRTNSNTFISNKDKSLSDHFGGDSSLKSSTGMPPGVNILVTAQGGYDDHVFFAMYCSNDYLIFRYVGQSKVPQYKYIPWSKETGKKIVSMSFDPTAQWLLCLSQDTSIIRIPIYFMMCKKINVLEEKAPQPIEKSDKLSSWVSSRRLFKSNTATPENKKPLHSMVSTPPLSTKGQIGSYCLWWKTSNSEDYGIIATTSGNIFFVNLSTNEIHRKMRFDNPIVKLDLIIGAYDTNLIIGTKTIGYHQLVIEQKINHHQYESIVSANNTPANKSLVLPAFATLTPLFAADRVFAERSLERQESSGDGASIMASYIRSTSKLEIYDSLYLHKFPLFVYQLPQGTTNFFFTKNITFISEVDHHDENAQFIKNQSIIQSFQLANGESVVGITSSLEDGDKDHGVVGTYLPSCFLWTNFAVYKLCPKKTPEEIFFELVGKNLEKSDGEALGKTFRMDLLGLYETAADHSFDQGQYGRALDLYYLSGVKTNKLVLKFLEIGRMDIIMTHLKAVLHQSDTFNVQERKKMTNILFQCYLQKLLQSREDFKNLDAEFSVFLSTNVDYDVGVALQLLLQHGLLDYFLAVAHSRRLVGKALMSLLESNILHLDAHNISFLQSTYALELKSVAGGMLFDCLSPDMQVKLILEDTANVPRYIKRLYHFLPLLSERTLVDIATAFDPLTFEPFNITPASSSAGSSLAKVGKESNSFSGAFQTQHHQQQQQQQQDSESFSFEPHSMLPGRASESMPVRNEEYFELYISTLLTLIAARTAANGEDYDAYLEAATTSPAVDNPVEEETSAPPPVVEDTDLLLAVMPPLMKHEKRAVSIVAGWEHVAVLTSDGELFTWGNNAHGQLGHGLAVGKCQTTPRRVDSFKSTAITMVAAGGDHTIAVDSTHFVYSWGAGRSGQLGHGVLTPQNLPKRIEEFAAGTKVLAIAAGYAHTLLLKKSGDLFVFGANEQGQLGIGLSKSQPVPKRLDMGNVIIHGGRISQIAAGHSHSVMCVDNGDIYTWGANNKGQLGHGTFDSTPVSRPKQIEELRGKPIKKIACGHYHTVVTTDLNSVYCWGHGEHMCLGNGSTKNEPSPKLIEFFVNKKVERVVCGLFHTATVTAAESGSDRGNVYICGGGEHGKLGIGGDHKSPFLDKPYPAVVPSLNSINIVDLCSGAEFSAAVTSNGAVYTWGYGHFGQIGNGKLDDICLPTRVPLHDGRLLLSSQNSKGFTKARYTQEGLEEVLKSHPSSYRPFFVINKARQFENWDAVATVFDVLEDYKSTLECRLIGLKKRNFDKEKEMGVLMQLLHGYIIKGSIFGIDSPPMISTTAASPVPLSPPLFGSPLMGSTQELYPPSPISALHTATAPTTADGKKLTSPEKSKELLLLLILNYWKEKELSIEPLETYILNNIDSFSLPLSNILQMNVGQPHPLVLDFSPSLYLIVVKYYLQLMKTLGDRERDLQRASEKVLLTNIKENLEKDISSRTKIQIHTLHPDVSSAHVDQHVGGKFEKDVAFTCNHFFSKRRYFGEVLPHFQAEVQKLGMPSQTTLKHIMEEYNQKWISLSCPVCLYNFLREFANDPLSKPWKI